MYQPKWPSHPVFTETPKMTQNTPKFYLRWNERLLSTGLHIGTRYSARFSRNGIESITLLQRVHTICCVQFFWIQKSEEAAQNLTQHTFAQLYYAFYCYGAILLAFLFLILLLLLDTIGFFLSLRIVKNSSSSFYNFIFNNRYCLFCNIHLAAN